MVQRWQRGYPAGGIGLEAWGRALRLWAAAVRRVWGGGASGRAEQVELLARRFAYQPLRFRWHGRQHRVQRIERVWERARAGSSRRYFRVRCGDERYTLFQDLRLGAWYVEVI